ncbi:AbrB/MazE/SpoVT family DNA-binding domain-containing protein [Deinococcus sp. QL22]|uniref:AbrB/MazE/SpoVT family DNA-binding domain-containing protein n=1 Tax=Deinococcus sp. QL22 TaxID=2939437 RepID=UPI0020177651|nr:AbrB/MazE/SpoVT family DNA-binding domain-containing protein [Deinococcus sp. QL22]UQN09486.1 AbrB/MazE/SpoVT family DNA-binding domain-containing protein [Deinococcus sp. QL22]
MTVMLSYHLKLQAQGRLVVPTDVRAELGLKEGDEVILLKESNGYRLTSRSLLAAALLGSLQKTGAPELDLTAELLSDRQAEAAQKGW